MGDTEVNYLEVYPEWLRSLSADAEGLGAVIGDGELPEPARQVLAGALNYLFKSLDLIPDGIDDIGYLDDAFVLRVAADQAMQADVSSAGTDGLRLLNRLAGDNDVIKDFLGADYGRIDAYVAGLTKTPSRGRSVADILHDGPTQSAFLADLKAFASAYRPPRFAQEDKTLIKLAAFFDAKLPK